MRARGGVFPPPVNADGKVLSALLTPYIKKYASDYAETSFAKLGTLDQPKDRGDGSFLPNVTEATASPAPLVFRVMELATAGSDTDPDPLRGMRGVGVLLRRVAPGVNPQPMHDGEHRWYVLNVVAVKDQLGGPLLVASRLGYDRDLRTGLISYNNGPLPVSNLLQEYGKQKLSFTKSDSLFENPLFPFIPYEGTGGDPEEIKFLRKTPMLRFGDVFDARFFAFTNVGVLPEDIADSHHPAKLSLPKVLSLPPTPLQLPYGRTVRVGHMSISKIENMPVPSERAQLPSPPAQVWPRAHEVEPRNEFANATPDETRSADSLPLVFLTNGKRGSSLASSTTLHLRLPNVDVQTWDRWIGYQYSDEDRVTILDEALTADPKKSDNSAPADQSRITDPAIAGVAFRLHKFTGNKWEQQRSETKFELNYPPIANATKLDDLLQQPMTVDIAIGSDSDNPITLHANNTVSIRVQPGEVYELEVLLKFVPGAASK